MTQDPRQPVAHKLQESPAGLELVIALYTTGCLYGACSFCSLPELSAKDAAVPEEDVKAQVDAVLAAHAPELLARVRRVAVFNSGSVLDQRTLATGALLHLFERLRELPSLETVCLDTRAQYVEAAELDALLARLSGRSLELAVGYETQDERIRNGILRKGLSEGTFQALCALLASKRVKLKAYVMVKPDVALPDDGVPEAVRTLEHLAATAERHGLEVSAHLNPTYVARGSALEKEFREQGYTPPRLWSVVDILLAVEGRGLLVQVGLDDETLAVEGGTFHNCGACDEAVRAALREFSARQEYAPLKGLSCACRAARPAAVA